MRIALKVASATALTLSLSACASGPSYDYYKVVSRFQASPQASTPPEIIATPAYQSLAKTGLTVAVRAPDRCTNATTNQATGQAQAAGSIIQTDCGVEMGEIERALTRAGYRVISWNVLNKEMARNDSATSVAQTLGAQVLFQINSLENSRKTLGQDARWERTFFRTDPTGTSATPLLLDDAGRAQLAGSYLAPAESKANVRAYAVALDAAAIWVPTGQAVWYYRWVKARQPANTGGGVQVNLACMQGYGFGSCQGFTPRSNAAAPGSVIAAGESVGVSAGERPEDVERAVYAELYREVVENFVQSFARG